MEGCSAEDVVAADISSICSRLDVCRQYNLIDCFGKDRKDDPLSASLTKTQGITMGVCKTAWVIY